MLKTWAEQRILASSLDAVLGVGGSPTTHIWTTSVRAWQASALTISNRRDRLGHELVSAAPCGSRHRIVNNDFTVDRDSLTKVTSKLAAVFGLTLPEAWIHHVGLLDEWACFSSGA